MNEVRVGKSRLACPLPACAAGSHAVEADVVPISFPHNNREVDDAKS